MRLPLGLSPRSSETPPFAVDRFTLLDGCVVASGWASGEPPRLLCDSAPVRGASLFVEPRRDLASLFGLKVEPRAFRLCAALGPKVRAETLSLHFPPDARVPITDVPDAPLPFRRAHEIMSRFIAAVAAEPGRLVEIGSRSRSGNSYRGLFPGDLDYVGLDVTDGPNVDLVGDAHHLRRHLAGGVRYAFSISVFEHLLMPWKVAIELGHVLAVGGLAFIQSHAAWPLHEEPWDFWRFSRESWHGLFNVHTGFEIVEAGYDLPAAIVPRHLVQAPVIGLERQPTYLLSACLARKIADPKVAWDAEAAEVYDLAYSHR